MIRRWLTGTRPRGYPYLERRRRAIPVVGRSDARYPNDAPKPSNRAGRPPNGQDAEAASANAQQPSTPFDVQTFVSNNPSISTALSTLIGLGIVVLGGALYVKWYKGNVLRKIEQAFDAGYDPALQLADHGARKRSEQWGEKEMLPGNVDWVHDVRRREQDAIDALVHGETHGLYVLLMGSKGMGKTTMILDAMRRVQADGVAICEAHEDLEVFRLRLGKALNYEFNEDSQTGLFQRRDPREGGPRLDIERALNKLEKVALRTAKKRRKPLVFIINNIQLFSNDEDSRALLLQLQQKAEAWAESHLITVIFSTDDFWPYPLLRKVANRLKVISISDLNPSESLAAFRNLRRNIHGKSEDDGYLRQVLAISGGRLAYMNRLAHSDELATEAQQMMRTEKGWLLSQIGLIPDCDDDVMDEQKMCSSAWLLLREFARQFREEERRARADSSLSDEVVLPSLTYYRCRQIMTRADFIEQLDKLNIISIDTEHNIRPDSTILLRAALEIVETEGFDDLLESVRSRIDDIESLHRTRELTWKTSDEGDVLRVMMQQSK